MGQSGDLPETSTDEGLLKPAGVPHHSRTLVDDIGLRANGLSDGPVNTGDLSSTQLIELLQADQLRRWRSGESPRAESYLERWPALRESDDALDLVYAEVLLRRERGESPGLAEYQERFPRFAEALQLHFELEPWVADEPAVSNLLKGTLEDSLAAAGASRRSRSAAPTVPGYEIEGELGRGGMGVVYKARQVRLNRVCALKMILAGAHADPEAFLRFLGEAESVARLNHPNIIQIHHTGEVDGLPFLELEYVDGESLAAELNGTPWAPRRAAELVAVLARAMAEAHRLGVVHRDLKPANILLTGDGTPKITDFGLAKALGTDSGLTRTNSVIGSPSYMAPEQAEGHARDAGPTTDIYSLGAILYELLTGRPPFKATSVAETMEQVRTLEPVAPARLVPGLPRDVETICLTCLRKEPSRRYGSATELADDLERFLGGQVIRSRRSTQFERGWRWARRNRTVATLLAALFLSMAAGFGGTILLWRRAEHEAKKATLLASSETSLRSAAQARAASLALDRGLALADDGDPDRALHWFARAAQTAPDSEPGLIGIARANLASFGAMMPVLKGIFTAIEPGHELFIGPDVRTVLESGPDGFAGLKDAATGHDLGSPLPHSVPVDAVAFSTDCATLATWSRDRQVRLWSVPEGRPLASWSTLEFPGTLLFNPSGRMVATLGWQKSAGQSDGGDRRLRLWSLPEGHEVDAPAIDPGLRLLAAAFSPDGTTLALSHQPDGTRLGDAILWELRTRKTQRVPIGDTHGFHAIRFSADCKLVLLLSVNKGAICDVRTGQLALAHPIHPPTLPEVNTQDQALFTSGFLTPDGGTFALGDSLGYVQFREARTGRLYGPIIRHGSSVDEMAVSPDGQTALIVGGFTARLYDIPTGQPLGGKMGLFHDPTATKTHRRALTFDAEGRTAAIVSGGTAAVWDITPARANARVIPHRTGPGPLAFSPDGTRLLTGSLLEPMARLWDTATCEPVGPVLVHDSPRSGGGTTRVHVVAFSPDGRVAITAGEDRFVRFWDPLTGRALRQPLLQPHWVVSALFSPDGKSLLVGTAAGMAALWDLAADPPTHKIIKARGPQAQELAFSPDGQKALIRSYESDPLLIETSTGNVIKTLHEPIGSFGLVFLAGGQSVVSRAGGSLFRFDPQNGSVLGPRFGSSVNVFAISFDGRRALTGAEDGSLRIWDALTGVATGSAMAHRSPIRAVAISPDGRMAASGDQEGTIRFWNVATRRQVGPPVALGVQASHIVFSPDGRLLAANGSVVRLCDVPDLNRVVTARPDLWAQVLTGHRLDEIGGVIPLEQSEWEQLRQDVRSSDADESPLVALNQPADRRVFDWHERHAEDSERQRLWYSALWHLDRMIAIQPDKAWLHARRLRIIRLSGQDDTREEKQFRALASPGEQAAWDSEEALRHEASADWPAAISCFDRLVAAMPEDQWLRHRRARVFARLGRWPEASAELAKSVKPEFTSPFLFNERILALLRAGDRQGYRSSCGELLAQVDAAPSPLKAYMVALACTVGPDAATDQNIVIHVAEIALNGFREESKADALFALGAALYRAGRLEQAVERLTDSVKRRGDSPRVWAYLAMAQLAAGHEPMARPWIERLKRRAPGRATTDFWDEVEIDILSREVETVRNRHKDPHEVTLPDK